jgi:hypothetical protein
VPHQLIFLNIDLEVKNGGGLLNGIALYRFWVRLNVTEMNGLGMNSNEMTLGSRCM